MEADKVDKFLLANESKFPDYEIPIHRLLDLPPEKEAILAKNHFKSPICMLSVSCFLGYFGLDRFLIGDWGKGIIKLLRRWSGNLVHHRLVPDRESDKEEEYGKIRRDHKSPLTIILAVLPDIEVR